MFMHLYLVLCYKEREKEKKTEKKRENEFYVARSVRQIEWKRLSRISLRINDSNDAVSPTLNDERKKKKGSNPPAAILLQRSSVYASPMMRIKY
jgi:hypothetical protein